VELDHGPQRRFEANLEDYQQVNAVQLYADVLSSAETKRSGNLKGAESDARKTVTEVPLITMQRATDSTDAEPSVVEAEPIFQQKYLADGIGQVGELDDQVRNGQVVAVAFPADQAAVS